MSAKGTQAYLNGPSRTHTRLVWLGPGGKLEETSFPARAYTSVSLSPDGRRAAAGVLEAGRYVIRLLDFRQRTDDSIDLPGSNWSPVWHPDDRRLAFRSMRKGDFDTYWKDLTSTAPPEPLLVTDRDDSPGAFTPDGKSLIVEQSEADGSYPLKMLSLERPADLVTLVPFASTGPVVRPDGKFVAFSSWRSGTNEIYVVPVSGGAAERISTRGGQAAAWSIDGRELYYARPPEILAVTLQMEGGRLRPAGERVWARVEGSDPEDIFAVGPDGRILIALPREHVVRQIRVVLGWDREVAEKLKGR
jgi:Tol biopolymer transport system component